MSLQLQVNASLKPFNSFGVDVRASLFAEARSDDDVREALQCSAQRNLPLLVIGGGGKSAGHAGVDSVIELDKDDRGVGAGDQSAFGSVHAASAVRVGARSAKYNGLDVVISLVRVLDER